MSPCFSDKLQEHAYLALHVNLSIYVAQMCLDGARPDIQPAGYSVVAQSAAHHFRYLPFSGSESVTMLDMEPLFTVYQDRGRPTRSRVIRPAVGSC